MTLLHAVLVVVAGLAAGTINTVVGSGSLVTFPTLLALGYPPVVANVSNTVGLVPGSVSGAVGYRRELKGQRTRLLRNSVAAVLGGLTGALLLLTLDKSVFAAVVPALILLGCLLVVIQPQLSAWVRGRRAGEEQRHHGSWLVWVAVFATSIYGGYFGAAQGVLFMAVLGLGLDDTLQRLNATKNVLAAIVNGVAAVVFVLVAHVDWLAAGLIAIGATVGGQVGATVGRRLPDVVLRGFVVVVGVAAVVQFLG
ncbi:MAG: sulfite exporter TauE/SafE family protein [Nocardioidaceae bacterium]